jgi:alkylhydroperoxidase/carboxymuconolactone decarboxylase family protein YurZ
MAPNDGARKQHDGLFPDCISTLAVTDPELIEIFDNTDEVLSESGLDVRTRRMAQLAAIIASQAVSEYRDRARLIDVATQILPLVGYPRTLNALRAIDEVR